MLEFFMGKILPGVMIFLLLALCAGVGAFPASAVAGGPGSVFGWGLLAMIVMAAFCAIVGYVAWGIANLADPKTGAVIIGIVAAVCTLVLPINTLINGYRDAAIHGEMAPKVQSFALRHFDDIDANHDGTITDGEMQQAIEQLRLSAEEREILTYLRAQQSEAGHVISSSTTTTWVWISIGNSGYLSPITTTHYLYGINRQDLAGYPSRVTERYKKW